MLQNNKTNVPVLKIAVSGATGFIGKKLTERLIELGHNVVVISRNAKRAKKEITGAKQYIEWKDAGSNDFLNALEHTKSIIHLAGKNILSSRWTERHKKEILESRISTTNILTDCVCKLKSKPESFISASATGYYGFSTDKIFTENDPPGDDFLARVTEKWEEASNNLLKENVRVVNIRTAVVMDKSGGFIKKMLLPFKFFMGGYPGPGTQWLPWITLDDLINIYLFALQNEKISGPLNAAANEHIQMKDFCISFGKSLHRPTYLKIPVFLLKLVFGEGTQYITKGARIEPLVLKENNIILYKSFIQAKK